MLSGATTSAKRGPRFHNDPSLAEGRWFDDLCRWWLPEHLRQEWWSEAEARMEGRQKTASGFAESLREFLRFKELPGAGDLRFRIEVRNPGDPAYAFPTGLRGLPQLGDGLARIAISDASGTRELSLKPGAGVMLPATEAPALRPVDTGANESEPEVWLLIEAGTR